MTETERIEYQAETARLRAANVARVQQDAENLRAYDKAVRDALQALRDADHATAIVMAISNAEKHVYAEHVEQCHAEALVIDAARHAFLFEGPPSTDAHQPREPHPAEPHSRRPTECRVCRRPIVGRFDDGIAISYTHREKASAL